jgi:hypothetical protein
MKALSLSLFHVAALIGCATAQDAYLYNLDIQPRATSSPKSSSIDSETANAILARRLGATESRKLGHVDDVVLDYLNDYGGQRMLSLFGDGRASSTSSRLVISIEGYDGVHRNTMSCLQLLRSNCRHLGEPLPASPGLKIERANTDLASSSYMKNLVEQDGAGTTICNTYMPLKSGMHVTYISSPKVWQCNHPMSMQNG